MKYNKKGFTLVELIGALVILSLLVTISTSVFINVRNSSLEKEYNNLVLYLETKAVEYASNNDITLVSVGDLIKEGYIDPDDETDIYDPRNNKSLNCNLIKLEFTDGEYIADFLEAENKNDDGSCKTYNQTKNYQICQVQNNVCVGDLNNWLSDNVTLGVTYKGELINEQATYSWISNTGFTSNDRFVNTLVRRAGQVYYTCEVELNDNKGKAIKLVKIDKEPPVVTNVLVNDDTLNNTGTYDISVYVEDIYNQISDTYTISEYLIFCFVAGTKVQTANGLVNIEDIKIGDYVYTINENTNQKELKQVTNTITSSTKITYEITAGDTVVEPSPRHPFYVVDKGWTRAYNLEEGDMILTTNGAIKVDNIKVNYYEQEITTYNLTIEDNHNFLVTDKEFLVHNMEASFDY